MSRAIPSSRPISGRISRRLLAAWGRNDAHFLPAGAEAYRRDLPEAEVHLLDAGHFALETHAAEIGALMRGFLQRQGF